MSVVALRKQIAEAQAKLEAETAKLQAERAQLVARLAVIDAELAGEAKPSRERSKGIGKQVLAYVQAHPNSTIKEVQAGLPELPASKVESTMRGQAKKGILVKDDSSTKKYSVPSSTPAQPAAKVPTSNGARPH